MAMSKRKPETQETLWVETAALRQSPGHPFYEKLNEILQMHGFDAFVENLCTKYYHEKMGRPSIAPGVYFRMLLIGYFEGIDSERGIAWRVADSLGLRRFLGCELNASTPDHSSVSRTRRMMELETHQEVFNWVLTVLAKENLLKGKTLGIDATTLEANAALRSIVRRDSGEKYHEYLTRLAKVSGIETPTRADLTKLDKKRPKKGSNEDWEHPEDPDAKIGKMKDGRTHLLHKAEHATDMETGAVVAVTLADGNEGDTESGPWTLMQAQENLKKVGEDEEAKTAISETVKEAVLDKGYHSNDVLVHLDEEEVRSYVSEPDRGRRRWEGKKIDQAAVYANRRRIRGEHGQALMRRRGEIVERSFAHCYETGAMRRLHLRHRGNILKRLLVHVAGFNLGLVLRDLTGRGTPRGLRALLGRFFDFAARQLRALFEQLVQFFSVEPIRLRNPVGTATSAKITTSATGC
jgi:transposase